MMDNSIDNSNGLAWFFKDLESFEEAPFFITGDVVYSYNRLRVESFTWGGELEKLQIEAGECVGMIGDYSPQTVALFLALLRKQAIIVPLSPDVKNKEECFEVAAVSGVFDLSGQEGCWQYRKIVNRTSPMLYDRLRRESNPGLVIFSSGTSGKSKAALLSLPNLFDKYKDRRKKPFRTLAFLKMDHIGGINTLIATLCNGGCLVTSTKRTADSICRLIERTGVELFPTTPTFLNMLLVSGIYRRFDLSSLRMITYGTEPMPESTLALLHNLFPQVQLKQTYGLTELGIFSTQSKDCRSTWIKIGGSGIQTRIEGNTLWVKSNSAMLGYLNAQDPFDEEGWYNTGDKVEVAGDYLRILGRETDIINVGGEKVFPVEVESVLLEMPEIRDVVVKGKKNPVTGELVCAIVILKEGIAAENMEQKVVRFCRDKLAPFKIPRIIEIQTKSLANGRFKKKR